MFIATRGSEVVRQNKLKKADKLKELLKYGRRRGVVDMGRILIIIF